MTTRRRAVRTLAAVVMTGALGLTTACSDGGALWQDGDKKTPPKGPEIAASITGPRADARDVPASAEIEFTTAHAASATVELKDASGKAVQGELRGGTAQATDPQAWVPSAELDYGTTYTATVTATASDGKTATTTSTFTTMSKPANTVRVSTNIGDGMVVGVGMAMVVRFGRAVPKDARDDVERRMWVRSEPAQEGSWHWFGDSEVHYRPREFWQAGTTLHYRLGTGGLPMGAGWYGRSDLTVDAKVGDAVVMTVDNATKQMTVTKNGAVLRTIPVSLGKPKTPSSSGTMIVMEKLKKTVFDTRTDPDPENRYVVDIEYAQRLTWGGEFIHAAPWSVGDQGRRNVSHGCVNMSMEAASWLFGITKVGDPITVKGTERTLQKGNGWTDWSMPWEDYVKGSALPRTAATASDPSPRASD